MKIIIIGGKGTAVNIAEAIIDAHNNYGYKDELLGFAIDDPSLGKIINGIPVLCKISDIDSMYGKYSDVKLLFALYKPSVMESRVNLLRSLNFSDDRFTNFIHPLVYKANSAILGVGNIVLAHACINSNVLIGNFNIINQSVIIEHDTSISNSNFFAAGSIIGSHVKISNGNFFGIHSSVRESVEIANYNILGMGGVLLSNLESYKIVAGVPAKEI